MGEKLLAEWFWIDRWMGSSAFLLPMEARGIYREMLSQAWRRGAKLPNNHQAIQRAIGSTPKEWNRSWPLIERFWRVVDGHLINETQQEIYAEALAKQEKNVIRAQAGAQARWGNSRKQCLSIPQAVPTQCPPSPSPISDQNKTYIPSTLTVEDDVAEKAGRFLEKYPVIYAEERRGAHFQLKPVLHFMTACELVQGWPDEQQLEAMFRIFCRLPQSEKMAWPGTPAQFLHLAPEIDAKLRAAS